MKLLIHFILLVSPFIVFANGNEFTGYGIISGTISTADGQPAAYVSVTIKNTGKGTITDNNGNFEIKKLKPGNYILLVSLLDYSESEITVEVKENETTLINIQLHQTDAQLKEVIVRARLNAKYVETKTSESLRLNLSLIEVPQNIAVVSNQLMADQGLISMTEAIRTVSGVQKTYGGLNDYSLIVRGTAISHWSLYRNGIGGYWWNQQEDAAMLEKIEFIKGPAGFMSNASDAGGVVNSVTKQPVKELVSVINAGFGSYNLMRLTGDFGGALSKSGKLYYRFNAGIHNQDRAFQFGKALRYYICPVIKYDFNTKTSVTAEYNYMWGRTLGNNDGLPSVNGKLFSLPQNFAVADDKTSRLIVADNYYRIQFKHNFNDYWHLNVQLAYVYGKWNSYQVSTNDFPVSNDTLYRYVNFDDIRNFSRVAMGFIDGKFYTGKKIEHKVLFGPDYTNWNVTDPYGSTWGEKKFGLYLPKPDYHINPDSLKNFQISDTFNLAVKSLAFYAQDNIKIAEKLIVTLAGRFTNILIDVPNSDVPDYQKKTRKNVFTPRAGLTWLFTDDISVYALYDKCYLEQTAPNFEHKRFKPLTGHNLEAGMKSFFFNKKLGLNFSLFHIVKNNIITSDPLHLGYYIQNGQAISNGVDFDLNGNITAALTVNANYEYADAKITKDNDANLVGLKNFGTPDHSGNLWMKYKLQKGKLKGVSFAMGYQYMGKRSGASTDNPDKTKFLPTYNLLDAALGYNNEKFNISLNIYNITNINYATLGYFSTNADEWRYTPGEPVNFRLSLGVNLVQHKKVK
ncbi:MAG: TonB-dependent receptor [Ferruginibacter sp.]